ncbi:MAG: hypothetical protein ACE5IZ_02135 [Dehalococcoidia bacterium]
MYEADLPPRNGVRQTGTSWVARDRQKARVAAGAFPQVKTAISMSPNASPAGGILLGHDVPNFRPRSVLFMSDERESGDAQALASAAAQPVAIKVYPGRSSHGIALLDNPQAVQDILDWLSQTL